MPHEARYSEIKVPEFINHEETWQRYSTLQAGGTPLIDELPKIDNEPDEQLKQRKRIAVDFAALKNEIQGQVDILNLSDMKTSVENSQKVDDIFQAKNTGVDGQNATAMSFMLNCVLPTALTYGKAYVVVDRVAMQPGLSEAEAEKTAAPYAYVLSPLELPAFSFSDPQRQTITQAITRGLLPIEHDEIGFVTSNQPTWTLWQNDRIFIQNEKGDLIGQPDAQGGFTEPFRANTIGRVPIIKFELNDSFLADLWEAVISMLHHFSLASHGGSNQIYGMLTVFSDSTVKIIDASANAGLQLGQDDKIQMVNSPVEGLEFNLKLVEQVKMQLKRLFRKRMASMTAKAVQESGVAKKVDQAPQEAFSKFLANSIKDFLPELASLFAAYVDPTNQNNLEINTELPQEFVSRDRAADFDNMNAVLMWQPKTEADWIAKEKRLRDLSGNEEKMSKEDVKAANEELIVKAKEFFANLEPVDPNGLTDNDLNNSELE